MFLPRKAGAYARRPGTVNPPIVRQFERLGKLFSAGLVAVPWPFAHLPVRLRVVKTMQDRMQ